MYSHTHNAESAKDLNLEYKSSSFVSQRLIHSLDFDFTIVSVTFSQSATSSNIKIKILKSS